MSKIKLWLEKWQHRLQGHMVVTFKLENEQEFSFWVKDIYSENGSLWVDVIGSTTGQLALTSFPKDVEVTITGA